MKDATCETLSVSGRSEWTVCREKLNSMATDVYWRNVQSVGQIITGGNSMGKLMSTNIKYTIQCLYVHKKLKVDVL